MNLDWTRNGPVLELDNIQKYSKRFRNLQKSEAFRNLQKPSQKLTTHEQADIRTCRAALSQLKTEFNTYLTHYQEASNCLSIVVLVFVYDNLTIKTLEEPQHER